MFLEKWNIKNLSKIGKKEKSIKLQCLGVCVRKKSNRVEKKYFEIIYLNWKKWVNK